MKIKSSLVVALFVFALPVAADTKLNDQMNTIDAAVADADAKAEKACVLAKIKLRKQAGEDLAAAKKEAMRKEDLESAVAAKKKMEGISAEMDALLASAGGGKKGDGKTREAKAETPAAEPAKNPEGDKRAGQALVLQSKGRFSYTVRKTGTCDYEDATTGFARKGVWKPWGANGICMSFTDGAKVYFYKRDKKGDAYHEGDENGPHKSVVWDCTFQ